MALTKISGGVVQSGNFSVGVITATNLQIGSATTIHTTGIDLGSGNITSHNINSTGIITANSFGAINGTTASFSGDVSIGGTLTYADVTNIDSVGIITAQSAVSIADSIFHTGDIDTSIRFPSADTFTVETASSERLRIDSAGRLLVGTATEITVANPSIQLADTSTAILALARNDSSISAGNALGTIEIYGNDGGSYQMCASIAAQADGTHANDDKPTRLVFSTTADNASSPTERLRIDSSGRVLIGSQSNVGSSSVLQVREDGFGRNVEIFRSYDSANTPARIRFSNSRGDVDSPTIVVDGDDLGEIRFNGHDGTNYDTPAAAIFASVDGTPDVDDMPGRLEFHTTTSGATATEKLRITKNGAFGLGGANYGTSGQVIKSNGSSNAPTWQNLYSFMFYGEQDTHHNVAATTWTSIKNLGTRDFSAGDSDIAVFSESNGTLTIGNSGAGYWFLSMGAGIDDIDVSDLMQVAIDKNGSDTALGNRLSSYSRSWNGSTNDQVVTANVSCIANLSANDVVRFYVYHTCTSTEKTEENRTFAMGYRIG